MWGTLLRYQLGGDSIHWLIITAASEPLFTASQIKVQAEQVEAVRQAYHFETLNWLKLPSTELDNIPLNYLVDKIRQVVMKLAPDVVFVPSNSDVHSDHRVTYQAVQSVIKSFYMRSLGVKKVLACEVLSETDASFTVIENVFLPNVYVDISDTLTKKIEIMNMFQSEIHPEPLPRNSSAILSQARFRGATIGVNYAEAFMLLREIDG